MPSDERATNRPSRVVGRSCTITIKGRTIGGDDLVTLAGTIQAPPKVALDEARHCSVTGLVLNGAVVTIQRVEADDVDL